MFNCLMCLLQLLIADVLFQPIIPCHVLLGNNVLLMETQGPSDSAPAKQPDQGPNNGRAPSSIPMGQDTHTLSNGNISPTKPDIPGRAHDLTGQALYFLSTASNETLGACIVGLGAITYLLLGRVGLLLIGLVGGVVLHATWEDNASSDAGDDATKAEARKRREKGLEIVQRLLDLRDRSRVTGEAEDDNKTDSISTLSGLNFSDFSYDTKAALEGFTNAVIRDYVHWWYTPILPIDSSFPFACRKTLNGFVLSVSSHLSRKRPADVFLDFLTNSSSIMIVFLSELSSALAASRGLAPQEAIIEYLQENPGCSLSNVLDKKQQKNKLTAVAEDILQTFLDRKAFGCEPVRTFLREVLAGLILEMTVARCSRAEFINEWIIYALEEGDTTELVQAIDAGVSSAASNSAVKSAAVFADKSAYLDPLGTTSSTDAQSSTKAEHKRTVSRAEAAMEEAMREAQRLNEMIAADEAKRTRASLERSPVDDSSPPDQRHSESTTRGSSESTPIAAIQEEATTTLNLQPKATFKSFDQILSSQQPTALRSDTPASQPSPPPPLTLHNATISIFDDSVQGEKGTIRSKPVAEYLLQIEPPTSHYPGWMIARKYPDFETLHEVLRRISVISGVAAFAERHQSLPGWRNKTKSSLRVELEKYLRDALSYQRLAESEGMKRFLEKDQHLGRASPGTKQGGFGFPNPAAFETMGKGMLDVLTSAPKGAATGGKALVGGVTGVLGGVSSLGQKKQVSKPSVERSTGSVAPSTQLSRSDSNTAHMLQQPRLSDVDLQRPHTSSRESLHDHDNDLTDATDPSSMNQMQNSEALIQQNGAKLESTATAGEPAPNGVQSGNRDSSETPDPSRNHLHLPPPPSEIADDYSTNQNTSNPSLNDSPSLRASTITAPTAHESSRKGTASSLRLPEPPTTKSSRPSHAPLTLQETTVAVELFFATINELYTLSSAWTLRLTLLNTAKTFLLRPGNANLEAIRHLLQSTIIAANTSDAGIASHINAIRANALPTEEELKAWPPPPTEEEKERMRVKARRLLVEKGMPQALTSVMGQAASGEALGKVFDCLQIEEVARGLVFALVLQGVRAITQ